MPLSGIGQPGCPAHNIPSPQRGQGWQLPSGKSGPQTCVHAMPGSYARQMEAEDQQMSELEGTRTLTVPVRQHLVLALSFSRWQKLVPREVLRTCPRLQRELPAELGPENSLPLILDQAGLISSRKCDFSIQFGTLSLLQMSNGSPCSCPDNS